MRWNKICGFILIFLLLANAGRAQSPHFVKYNTQIVSVSKSVSTNSLSSSLQNSKPVFNSIQIIPSDYYTQHFGFFCKKELAVEKFTKIPLRLRLGSLQQCNYYEGKK